MEKQFDHARWSIKYYWRNLKSLRDMHCQKKSLQKYKGHERKVLRNEATCFLQTIMSHLIFKIFKSGNTFSDFHSCDYFAIYLVTGLEISVKNE